MVIFAVHWLGVPAVQSYMTEASPKERQGFSFGILLASESVALILSPLVGGVIIDLFGFVALFTVSFALFTISTLIVIAIPKFPGDLKPPKVIFAPQPDLSTLEKRAANSGDNNMRSTLKQLVPMLVVVCSFAGVESLGASFIPLYLSDQYGFDYFGVDLMYVYLNVASILIIVGIGRVSDKCTLRGKVMLVAVPIAALSLAYYLLLDSSAQSFLPLSFALFGAYGAIFPLVFSVVACICASGNAGRIYGVVGTTIYAAAAATPFLGGVIFATDPQLPFQIALVCCLVLCILVVIAAKKSYRRIPVGLASKLQIDIAEEQ